MRASTLYFSQALPSSFALRRSSKDSAMPLSPTPRSSVRLLALTLCLAGSAAPASAQSTAPAPASSSANAPAATGDPAFEVATVKPAAPSPDGHVHINYPEGGAFSAINITLSALMQWAWDTPEKQILDGPAWLTSDRWDIQAKTDALMDSALRSMTSDQAHIVKRRMVQALLVDRFNLKVHKETRMLPAYDLVVAKSGSKLTESKASGKSFGVGRTYFNGEGLTMDLIAEDLSQISGRIVVDKTHLPGRYDLKLQWTPDDAPPTDNAAPSLFTAIEEQLGLKLESAKEPIPVLAIDHIQQPSAN
jgi:uncharacterized protein (TIGR03435 family)